MDLNVPIENVAGTVKDLIQKDKIKYIRVSETRTQTISLPPCSSVHCSPSK
ncbi:MAG: hypothetical protein LBV43_01550 [Prevotella sp.]|nr:hypothetical protein [Prevotella sp.]